MKGFKNIKVYVEGKGIIVTSVAVDNGKIAAIGDNLDVEEYLESKFSKICVVTWVVYNVLFRAK